MERKAMNYHGLNRMPPNLEKLDFAARLGPRRKGGKYGRREIKRQYDELEESSWTDLDAFDICEWVQGW